MTARQTGFDTRHGISSVPFKTRTKCKDACISVTLGSSVDHLLIILQAFLVLSYIWAHNRPIYIPSGLYFQNLLDNTRPYLEASKNIRGRTATF
jgi:hypothetical protein